jgi:hypothetical protein
VGQDFPPWLLCSVEPPFHFSSRHSLILFSDDKEIGPSADFLGGRVFWGGLDGKRGTNKVKTL